MAPGRHLATCKLLNAYGPTEATVTVTAAAIAPTTQWRTPAPLTMPIGNVLADRSIYMLDDSG